MFLADVLANVGSPNLESFENFTATNQRDLSTLTASDFVLSTQLTNRFGVYNVPDFFGTHATDGTNYVVTVVNEPLNFSFGTPQKAFGINITDFGDTVVPSSLVLSIDGVPLSSIASSFLPNGNELFFGVIDSTGTFSSATLTYGADAIGLDELYTAVPEPSAFLFGLIVLSAISYMNRKSCQAIEAARS